MKTNKKMWFVLMIVLAFLAISSCSHDEEDVVNKEIVVDEEDVGIDDILYNLKRVGILDKENGIRIYGIGNYSLLSFNYSGDSLLMSVDNVNYYPRIDRYDFYKCLSLTYFPNIIKDDDEKRTVTYTKDGYISKINSKLFADGISIECTVTYSYDGDGHLISSAGEGTFEGYNEYFGRYVYDGHFNFRNLNIWNNNILVRYNNVESVSVGSSMLIKLTKDVIFEYDFVNTEKYNNKHCQWPFTFLGIHEFIFYPDNPLYKLIYVGMFGRGPSYLPAGIAIKEKYEYGKYGKYDEYDESSYMVCKYVFNENGTISRFYYNTSYDDFYYSPLPRE